MRSNANVGLVMQNKFLKDRLQDFELYRKFMKNALVVWLKSWNDNDLHYLDGRGSKIMCFSPARFWLISTKILPSLKMYDFVCRGRQNDVNQRHFIDHQIFFIIWVDKLIEARKAIRWLAPKLFPWSRPRSNWARTFFTTKIWKSQDMSWKTNK